MDIQSDQCRVLSKLELAKQKLRKPLNKPFINSSDPLRFQDQILSYLKTVPNDALQEEEKKDGQDGSMKPFQRPKMKLFTLKVSEDGRVDIASSESAKSMSSSSSSPSSQSSSSDDTFKSMDENVDDKSNIQPRKFVQNYPSFNVELLDDDFAEVTSSNEQELDEEKGKMSARNKKTTLPKTEQRRQTLDTGKINLSLNQMQAPQSNSRLPGLDVIQNQKKRPSVYVPQEKIKELPGKESEEDKNKRDKESQGTFSDSESSEESQGSIGDALNQAKSQMTKKKLVMEKIIQEQNNESGSSLNSNLKSEQSQNNFRNNNNNKRDGSPVSHISMMTSVLSVRTKFTINDQNRKAALIDEIRSECYSRNSTNKPLSNRNQLRKLCKNVMINPTVGPGAQIQTNQVQNKTQPNDEADKKIQNINNSLLIVNMDTNNKGSLTPQVGQPKGLKKTKNVSFNTKVEQIFTNNLQGKSAPTSNIHEALKNLSEAQIQEIKDRIGTVVLKHLKLLTIKIALKKAAAQRSDKELTILAKYVKSLSIFNKYNHLTEDDFKKLAKQMKYEEHDRDSVIYRMDQSADNFYLLLGGEVTEEIKNPQIEQWDWAMNVFQSLLAWKCNVFDEMAYKSLLDYRQKQKRKQEQVNLSKQPMNNLLVKKDQNKGATISLNLKQVNQENEENDNSIVKKVAISGFKTIDEEETDVNQFQDIGDFQIQMTELDQLKLVQLKQFKKFNWFVQQRTFHKGDYFGDTALHVNKGSYVHIRSESVKVSSAWKVGVAVLQNSAFHTVLSSKIQEQMTTAQALEVTNEQQSSLV